MAMGIVSDSDFDSEKNRLNPSEELNKITKIIQSPAKGRGIGDKEVPNGLRKIIGQTSLLYGREEAIKLAKEFDISPSSVSAYAHGSHSTSSYDETPNKPIIDKTRERVITRARTKMMKAMGYITDEKLEQAKVRDLAGVAKDMSAIIKNMEPTTPDKGMEVNGPAFVFYSPQFKKEEEFDTIRAKE